MVETLEIRLHGRGGQGGVTCAKILASVYARLGFHVQTFGDYAGERSGAPVRAYTRVSRKPILNRNKVYEPDHLVILDANLLGPEALAGLVPGGSLLINSPEDPGSLGGRFPGHPLGVLDATAIARRHGIGTRSLVIVNTTIAGAFVRMQDLPLEELEKAYRSLGLLSNFPAAKEAFETVRVLGEGTGTAADSGIRDTEPASPPPSEVEPLVTHKESPPTGLKTGSWRTQVPAYVETLAPCNAWCPAGNDVVGFVQAIARDRVEEAASILARTTPFPGVCGRVCPAPCMEGCNRREYDGAVRIRGLERWVADRFPARRPEVQPSPAPRRFAVVGSGPAGLTASWTLARLGHRVVLFERGPLLGGVLRTGIPPYRLPREVLDREIGGILDLGVETRTSFDLDRNGLEDLRAEFDAILLATGLQSLRGLDLEGGDLPGVRQGIGFLEERNSGVLPPLRGRVLVLGGGNTAMDCARSALRAGAESVIVAYRRSLEEMPAIREEIEEAREEGVELRECLAPAAFLGNGRVEAARLEKMVLGDPGEDGRRRPVPTGEFLTVACDSVLLALGQSAKTSILPEGAGIEGGRVTGLPEGAPVYCAGDFATGEGTVTHAIGDGRRMAQRALLALGEELEVFERPDRTQAVPITDIRLDHFSKAPPGEERRRTDAARLHPDLEVNLGLESPLEAHRCFSCGHCTFCDTCLVYCPEGIVRRAEDGYELDYSYCKGCGICVEECPRRAMEMRT